MILFDAKVLPSFVGFSKPRDIFRWDCFDLPFAFDGTISPLSFGLRRVLRSLTTLPSNRCVSLQDSRRRRAPYQRVRRARHSAPSPPHCPCPCRCQLPCPARSSARQVNRKPRPVLLTAPPPTLAHSLRSVQLSPSDPLVRRPEPGGVQRPLGPRAFSDRPLLPRALRPCGRAAPSLALFCRGVRTSKQPLPGSGSGEKQKPGPTAASKASIDSFCRSLHSEA